MTTKTKKPAKAIKKGPRKPAKPLAKTKPPRAPEEPATPPGPAPEPMRDRNVGTRTVAVSMLEDAPWNFRLHPAAQRAALEGAIEELGFYGHPDVYETAEGKLRIIDGHLRKELLVAKYGPEATIEVNVTDFDESEAKKATLTKDPLAAMAETDGAKLQELLREVNISSPDLEAMLSSLHNEATKYDMPEIDQDNVPQMPGPATTKRGDLWILGDHRLLCGDSGSPADLDRLLDGQPIHLVNTDPPYNVKVEPRSNNAIAAGLSSFPMLHHQGFDLARHPEKAKATHKQLRPMDRPLANDFVSDEAFDALLLAWFGNMARCLVPGRAFYIWGGWINCTNYPAALKASGMYFAQSIIWVKEHAVLNRKDFLGDHEWCFYGCRDFDHQHDAAFYGWREGAAHRYFGPPNITDVWTCKKVNSQQKVHLTEKPVELGARAMQYSSQEGENVLDLFGGSGSTLMAAEQMKRHAFLMEMDDLYCDIIVKRWSEATGGEPVLIPGPLHDKAPKPRAKKAKK